MTPVGDDDIDRLLQQIAEQGTPHWMDADLTDIEVGYIDGLRKSGNYIRAWWGKIKERE